MFVSGFKLKITMLKLFRSLVFFCFLVNLYFPVKAQEIPEENWLCLKCHTSQTFTVHNEYTEMNERRLMNPFYILDTVQLKTGVHSSFSCTDCHSYEYKTYPHNGNLKLEPLLTCIDCHGGDETYASYQFERIVEEFEKSVHFEAHNETFTCSKCHSQHYYKATARTSSNVKEIVEFSNNMCISCHNSMSKYQLVTDGTNPQLIQAHEWLPNQELHFKHVRCIECHTVVVDSLNISHNIHGIEKAEKLCAECHSSNSKLQASLYKYENIQARSGNGTINTIIANDSYVIGAYQNPLLNLLSVLIFLATLAGIIIHTLFRILKK